MSSAPSRVHCFQGRISALRREHHTILLLEMFLDLGKISSCLLQSVSQVHCLTSLFNSCRQTKQDLIFTGGRS